jgi:hypothetical protein
MYEVYVERAFSPSSPSVHASALTVYQLAELSLRTAPSVGATWPAVVVSPSALTHAPLPISTSSTVDVVNRQACA